MGLPSGNRWAVSNLDATGPYFFQESPFQYECSYFSWGNVTPHNPISNTEFGYNFGDANPTAPYYEGQPYGDTPGSLLTGDIPLTNDAARRMLGSPWHMPSSADYVELITNCIYIDANGIEIDGAVKDKRVTVNGILGIYLQSKINAVRLFLPCTGYGQGTGRFSSGSLGYYWSSSWFSDKDAQILYFAGASVNPQSYRNRCRGYAIRPIWNPRDLRG